MIFHIWNTNFQLFRKKLKFVIPKRRCASEKQHGLESTMASAVAYVDPFYLSINVLLNSSYLCDRHFKLILFIYLFIYCLLLAFVQFLTEPEVKEGNFFISSIIY